MRLLVLLTLPVLVLGNLLDYKNAEDKLLNEFLIKTSDKKVTELELQEEIVHTSAKKHGIHYEEAKRRSIAGNRKWKKYPAAGGRSGKTLMVKLIDDQCIGNIPTCNCTSPFRTINGQCNNLNNPFLGAMSTPYIREIQVDDYNPKLDFSIYTEKNSCSDYKKKGNKSCTKGKNKYGCPVRHQLPSARTVSHRFHTNKNLESHKLTHMVAQFGQYLDHDMTLTPENQAFDCCSKSFDPNDNCYSIQVSPMDSWYGPRDVSCLEFSRSVAYCEENGGPRSQVNVVTSFIDASNVYSSDDETSASLRTFEGGKLKTGPNNLLPVVDGVEKGGDVRVLDMPGLATMNTLFLREHNRLCELIQLKRPQWTDELIFQNARRILVAEMQSIAYGQYLRTVLGAKNIDKDLQLSADGSFYENTLDPGITAEFATAAYRFGHSLVQGLIKMYATNNTGQVDSYMLWMNFFKMDKYRENNGKGMEEILMGLLNQPSQRVDKEFAFGLNNQLFPEPGNDFGQDLTARNIQRGRDHGIPGFCCYYKLYHDPKFNCKKGWKKKYKGISKEDWATLKTIYNCPSDIDLYTGGLAQAAYKGGITGKVFNQMKIKQFKRSKSGDRFFFTHKGQSGSFTKLARQTLINRTLGSIICDNTDITEVPPNVFIQSDPSDFIKCNQTQPLLGSAEIEQLLEIGLK